MAKKKIQLPTVLTEQSWFYEAHKEQLEPYLNQPYLSYSSQESFLEYTEDFIKQKFAKIKLPDGVYSGMGQYVGTAIENGKFNEDNPHGFIGQENLDLDTLRPEGAEYEKLIIIPREGYFILGFVDIYSESEKGVKIRDVKSGGKGKCDKYRGDDYTQVILYAHSQELMGKKIAETDVYFIRRENSHVRPPLKIGTEQFVIPLEYNAGRVKFALDKMDKAAQGISDLYTTYKKIFEK